MTRFKELRRLEAALERGDLPELEWALEFCKHMLRNLRLKQGIDRWRGLREKVEARITELHEQRAPARHTGSDRGAV